MTLGCLKVLGALYSHGFVYARSVALADTFGCRGARSLLSISSPNCRSGADNQILFLAPSFLSGVPPENARNNAVSIEDANDTPPMLPAAAPFQNQKRSFSRPSMCI